MHKQSFFLFLLLHGYVVRVPACSATPAAGGARARQCCHSEAPWGQLLRFDKHATKTLEHESHLKRSFCVMQGSIWEERENIPRGLMFTRTPYVELPAAVTLIYFINLVTSKPGNHNVVANTFQLIEDAVKKRGCIFHTTGSPVTQTFKLPSAWSQKCGSTEEINNIKWQIQNTNRAFFLCSLLVGCSRKNKPGTLWLCDMFPSHQNTQHSSLFTFHS